MLSGEVDRSASGEIWAKRAEQAIAMADGNVKGWAGNYMWNVLEPSKGVYDFSHIDADIAAMAGKRIIIGIQSINFGKYIPAYILNDPAYGPSETAGEYGYWMSNWGTPVPMPAKWRPAVMARWIALVQALAARYDGNPAVEAIIDRDETAWQIDSGSDYTVSAFRTQWDALASAASAALKRTTFIHQANWITGGDNQTMADFLQDAYVRRTGIGGPDIFGYSQLHSNPAYIASIGITMGAAGTSPGTDYRGKIPSIHDVQSPELIGGLGLFTPQDIFQFANQDLQASHILWNYVGSGTGNWSSVQAVIDSNPVTHLSCPTAYAAVGCNTGN
jgi:hypothetical protein